MESINTISAWARPYIPQNIPSLEKIISIVRKEFDRMLPPSFKKTLQNSAQYKYEIVFATACTALFFLYIRKRNMQRNEAPLPQNEDPAPSSEQSDDDIEIDIDVISDDESEPSPRETPKTEVELFTYLSELEERTCSREEIEACLERAQELENSYLVDGYSKIMSRIERGENADISIQYATVSQFSREVEDIASVPCRFCAYLFIERLFQLDNVNAIDPNWIDQIVYIGANQKKTIGSGTCYDEDLANFYMDNHISSALERETFNPENHLVTDDLEWYKAQHPEIHEMPISVYDHYINQWLYENDMGVTLTIHDRTFAIARRDNVYYLFDSHGATHSLNQKEAFVATFTEVRKLAEFLGEWHYPSRGSENTKNIIKFQIEFVATTYENINQQFENIFSQSIPEDLFENFVKENDLNAPFIKAKLARLILGEPDDRVEVVAFKRKESGS
ncbi:MAG: hypothetical protein ChlgKO_09240 [Chlamydiales bacterium]